MLVPARIYASAALLDQMDQGVFEQVTNVACLPGIVRAALCMPDGHWGYGFPIGGVAAFRADSGIISPGGIGFDINCGMRLVRTDLTEDEVRPRLRELVDALFAAVPSGVGAQGIRAAHRATSSPRSCARAPLVRARRATAGPRTSSAIEGGGCLPGADPAQVSAARRARGRGPARHARRRQPLPRDPGRASRMACTTRRRPAASASRPGPGSGDAALRVARLRPPDRHGLPAAVRRGHAAPTASPCATASWPARRSVRPRARPTSGR